MLGYAECVGGRRCVHKGGFADSCMIGLSDGIEVDDVLASPLPGASREGGSARHGQDLPVQENTFAIGDRVRLLVRGRMTPYLKNRQNGQVVNVTPTRVVVDWGGGFWCTNHLAGGLARAPQTGFRVGDIVSDLRGNRGRIMEILGMHRPLHRVHMQRFGVFWGYENELVAAGPECPAHVEPTPSVEATISGEAKIRTPERVVY
jgi:hypothetical protein